MLVTWASSADIHFENGGPVSVGAADPTKFAYISKYRQIVNLEFGISNIDNYSRLVHDSLFFEEPVARKKVKNCPSWVVRADNTVLTTAWIDQMFLAVQGFSNKYIVPRILTIDGFLEGVRDYGNCDITAHDRFLLLNALNANQVNHKLPTLEGHEIHWETNLEKARIAILKEELAVLQQQLDLVPPIELAVSAQEFSGEVGRLFSADTTPNRTVAVARDAGAPFWQ